MSGVEVVSTDRLAAMDEEELRRRLRNVRHILRRNADRRKRMQFETECCYLHREIEMREQRRTAHTKFISNKKQTQGVA